MHWMLCGQPVIQCSRGTRWWQPWHSTVLVTKERALLREKRKCAEVGPHKPMAGVCTAAAMCNSPESMPANNAPKEISAMVSSRVNWSTKDKTPGSAAVATSPKARWRAVPNWTIFANPSRPLQSYFRKRKLAWETLYADSHSHILGGFCAGAFSSARDGIRRHVGGIITAILRMVTENRP